MASDAYINTNSLKRILRGSTITPRTGLAKTSVALTAPLGPGTGRIVDFAYPDLVPLVVASHRSPDQYW